MTKKAAPETAAATAAAESRKEALLDAAARDSPVLTLIAKRLRAAKKKAKRAEEIESIKASGREINADQVLNPQYAMISFRLGSSQDHPPGSKRYLLRLSHV